MERNVCDSVIGMLLNIQGKTKDGLNTRQDLADMGIWSQLHLRSDGKKIYLPRAYYTLSKKDSKVRMCVDYRDLNRASPKDNFLP